MKKLKSVALADLVQIYKALGVTASMKERDKPVATPKHLAKVLLRYAKPAELRRELELRGYDDVRIRTVKSKKRGQPSATSWGRSMQGGAPGLEKNS